jgi:hypothetical protein
MVLNLIYHPQSRRYALTGPRPDHVHPDQPGSGQARAPPEPVLAFMRGVGAALTARPGPDARNLRPARQPPRASRRRQLGHLRQPPLISRHTRIRRVTSLHIAARQADRRGQSAVPAAVLFAGAALLP